MMSEGRAEEGGTRAPQLSAPPDPEGPASRHRSLSQDRGLSQSLLSATALQARKHHPSFIDKAPGASQIQNKPTTKQPRIGKSTETESRLGVAGWRVGE